MYNYHVTYTFNNGSGSIHIETPYRISTSEDVQRIKKYIEDFDGTPTPGLAIMNFIPLKRWWEFWK